jgi:hypothetical protein
MAFVNQKDMYVTFARFSFRDRSVDQCSFEAESTRSQSSKQSNIGEHYGSAAFYSHKQQTRCLPPFWTLVLCLWKLSDVLSGIKERSEQASVG